MNPDRTDDRAHRGKGEKDAAPRESIQLEPVTSIETPRYVIHGDTELWGESEDPPGPVPARPLHVCPTCDYILTGLTSRRCPECGEGFTLSEARRRAIETSPGMRRLYRAAQIDRVGGWIGVVLLAAAFVVPNIVGGGFSSWPRLGISGRGLAMLFVVVPLMIAACVAKVMLDAHWSRVMLYAGVVAAGVGAVVSSF